MVASDEILKRTSDQYRRIRNTFRFILGNLSDFSDKNKIAELRVSLLSKGGMVHYQLVESLTQSNAQTYPLIKTIKAIQRETINM